MSSNFDRKDFPELFENAKPMGDDNYLFENLELPKIEPDMIIYDQNENLFNEKDLNIDFDTNKLLNSNY